MNTVKRPSLLLSLVPIVCLMLLLGLNIVIFKDDATGGPNQLALLIVGMLVIGIGHFVLHVPYKTMEGQVIKSTSMALQASLILLTVGSLIGLWIVSGIVPAMIFYGLKLINPSFFLPVACITCSFVSLATGSSWSTSGTVGIALMGIGQTLQIPEGMVAGAIISGAYFGDKMSPLSDTTNLAPAMAGSELFSHIRHMLYTTLPAIVLAVVLFTFVGFFYGEGTMDPKEINSILQIIESKFSIGPHLFIAPAIVLFLIAKRVAAFPALFIGCLVGVVFALLFQQDLLRELCGSQCTIGDIYKQITLIAHSGFNIETGHALIDKLFSRGGMSSMLSTVWLILMAMVFGGSLEGTGMLQVIAESILKLVKGTGSLIGATLGSCIFVNMTASDQYLAIVVPGRMFRSAYRRYGLAAKNLSRALEDSGTVTSVLVPWSSGGAYNSGVLGVATLTYLPFCFFNLISPCISLLLGMTGWTIEKISEEEAKALESGEEA